MYIYMYIWCGAVGCLGQWVLSFSWVPGFQPFWALGCLASAVSVFLSSWVPLLLGHYSIATECTQRSHLKKTRMLSHQREHLHLLCRLFCNVYMCYEHTPTYYVHRARERAIIYGSSVYIYIYMCMNIYTHII